jgi:uncharacterized membrane protein
MYVYINVYMYVCMNVYAYMYECMYVWMCMYVCLCMHVYVCMFVLLWRSLKEQASQLRKEKEDSDRILEEAKMRYQDLELGTRIGWLINIDWQTNS